jgi:hypothetical protein
LLPTFANQKRSSSSRRRRRRRMKTASSSRLQRKKKTGQSSVKLTGPITFVYVRICVVYGGEGKEKKRLWKKYGSE